MPMREHDYSILTRCRLRENLGQPRPERGTTGALTVAALMCLVTLSPLTLRARGSVHWMGKGKPGRHEWALRMYRQASRESRANRSGTSVEIMPQLGLGYEFAGVGDKATPLR